MVIYNEFDIFAGNVKIEMCLPIEKERSRSIIAIVPETRLQIFVFCWCRLTGRHIQGRPFQCQWWFGRRRTQTDPSPPESMTVDNKIWFVDKPFHIPWRPRHRQCRRHGQASWSKTCSWNSNSCVTDNLQAGGRVHKQLQYNLSFDAVEVQRYFIYDSKARCNSFQYW